MALDRNELRRLIEAAGGTMAKAASKKVSAQVEIKLPEVTSHYVFSGEA